MTGAASAWLTGLAWLGTYALHSTILLGGAWLFFRFRASGSSRLRELVWRAALFGGIATATLQSSLGLEPLLGRFSLTVAEAPTELSPDALELPRTSRPLRADADTSHADLARMGKEELELLAGPMARGDLAATPGGETLPERASAWQGSEVLALWLMGCAIAVAQLGFTFSRLQRKLRDRRLVRSGRLPWILDSLRRRAGLRRSVKLFVSGHLPAPVTLGVLRPEIYLPERALVELDEDRLEAVLAHELAHVIRVDALWMLTAALVERLFFFQPLNRLARRRLSEVAEYQCDDWAVACTGRRVAMARSLTDVAAWIVGRHAAMPAPTMGQSSSQLTRRVERILDEERAPSAGGKRPWLSAATFLLLTPLALFVPGVIAVGEPLPRADGGEWEGAGDLARIGVVPTPPRAKVVPAATAARQVSPFSPAPSLAAVAPPVLAELDLEIEWLGQELSALRDEVGRRADAQSFGALIEAMTRNMELLRERRAQLARILASPGAWTRDGNEMAGAVR